MAAVAESAADSTPLHQLSLCRKHLDFELLVDAHVRVEGQFFVTISSLAIAACFAARNFSTAC